LSKSSGGITAEDKEIPDTFMSDAPLLGTLGILFGCIPVWVVDNQINVGKWSDRFLLAPMFGAVILLVWMMEWLSSKPQRKSVVLALILGFSIASHIQIATKYQQGWQLTRDYFWQLYWRVPALKSGTAILGTQLPLNYMSEYQIGYALNTIYDQNPRPGDVPYWFVDTGRRRGTERIPDFKEKLPINYSSRDVVFNSTTSQGLVVDYNTGQGCVHVLSSADQYAPGGVKDFDQLVQISYLDQIETNPEKASLPPVNIFGNEPAHDWCYFYEKADLARQMKNWQQVVSLDQQASQAGLSPNVGIELTPFIEGYAHLGQWDAAYQYTLSARKLTDGLTRHLCSTWQTLKDDTPDTARRETVLTALSQQLECIWH